MRGQKMHIIGAVTRLPFHWKYNSPDPKSAAILMALSPKLAAIYWPTFALQRLEDPSLEVASLRTFSGIDEAATLFLTGGHFEYSWFKVLARCLYRAYPLYDIVMPRGKPFREIIGILSQLGDGDVVSPATLDGILSFAAEQVKLQFPVRKITKQYRARAVAKLVAESILDAGQLALSVLRNASSGGAEGLMTSPIWGVVRAIAQHKADFLKRFDDLRDYMPEAAEAQMEIIIEYVDHSRPEFSEDILAGARKRAVHSVGAAKDPAEILSVPLTSSNLYDIIEEMRSVLSNALSPMYQRLFAIVCCETVLPIYSRLYADEQAIRRIKRMIAYLKTYALREPVIGNDPQKRIFYRDMSALATTHYQFAEGEPWYSPEGVVYDCARVFQFSCHEYGNAEDISLLHASEVFRRLAGQKNPSSPDYLPNLIPLRQKLAGLIRLNFMEADQEAKQHGYHGWPTLQGAWPRVVEATLMRESACQTIEAVRAAGPSDFVMARLDEAETQLSELSFAEEFLFPGARYDANDTPPSFSIPPPGERLELATLLIEGRGDPEWLLQQLREMEQQALSFGIRGGTDVRKK